MIKAIHRHKDSCLYYNHQKVIYQYKNAKHLHKLKHNKHIHLKVRIIINLFLNLGHGITIAVKLKVIKMVIRYLKIIKVHFHKDVCK